MNICTIYQNLVCFQGYKGLFVHSYEGVLVHLFVYSEQYPILFNSLGRVPATTQGVYTGVLMSYIFSYAIINEHMYYNINFLFFQIKALRSPTAHLLL